MEGGVICFCVGWNLQALASNQLLDSRIRGNDEDQLSCTSLGLLRRFGAACSNLADYACPGRVRLATA